LIFLILAAAVLIAVAGCGSPESRLVGKWVGKTGSIEFFKDKTGVINPPNGVTDLPANVQFKWDFVQKGTVRMIIAIGGGKTSLAKFSGRNVLIVEEDRFVKGK
jgi:hypothetical protein